jgi:triacylglycerol lipase
MLLECAPAAFVTHASHVTLPTWPSMSQSSSVTVPLTLKAWGGGSGGRVGMSSCSRPADICHPTRFALFYLSMVSNAPKRQAGRAGMDAPSAVAQAKADGKTKTAKPIPLARRLQGWSGGAKAYARQTVLLPRDVRTVVPPALESRDSVVVLVHGMFATAGVFRPLRDTLEDEGFATASFTHAPGFGVATLTEKLSEFLSSLPPTINIDLVGHSLGGVVARYYVQEYPRDRRVRQTVSLGGPFRGTRRARWMPGPAGRDLLPGSRLLDELQRGAEASQSETPHLSIVAGRDAMITEPAVLAGSEVMLAPECGHNGLLFDPLVTERLLQQLRKAHLIEHEEAGPRLIIDPNDE